MNINNKLHPVYLSYASCFMLARLGLTQEQGAAYWSRSDRQVYPSDRVAKSKGWEKLFIRAVSGDELNMLLPVGSSAIKTHKNLWAAEFQGIKVSAFSESEAKAELIKKLQSKGVIKL